MIDIGFTNGMNIILTSISMVSYASDGVFVCGLAKPPISAHGAQKKHFYNICETLETLMETLLLYIYINILSLKRKL